MAAVQFRLNQQHQNMEQTFMNNKQPKRKADGCERIGQGGFVPVIVLLIILIVVLVVILASCIKY
jgi:hypothetical protein